MSTWSAKQKAPAKVLPKSGGTQLRPKTLERAAKVLLPTLVNVARGQLLSLVPRHRKMPRGLWVQLSIWSAKQKAPAKGLPKLEGTQLKPRTLGRVAKVLSPTQEKGARGHPLNLTRLLSMLKREEIQLLRTVKEENVKLQN